LAGYECENSANQTNAPMLEMANKLTVVVTKLKKCLEIHKEFINKLLNQLKEKEEQLKEKKQANEVGGYRLFTCVCNFAPFQEMKIR
jgi:hypothetical protein